MSAITLEHGPVRVVADTDQGCSLLAFAVCRGGDWLPLMPDAHLGLSDLRFASFAMVPYSNRVEGGRFTFAGREHQLEGAAQHAIHGDVRQRPWEVVERTPARLIGRFDSAAHSHVNWPWAFEVRADIEVSAGALTQRLTLWNRGDTPMPAGLGWHPYFNRRLTSADDEVSLCFVTERAYPDGNDNRIPSGPPRLLKANEDFCQERVLEPDNFLDTCFWGYDGGGSIHWPGSGVRLGFRCSETCTHLILYNPQGAPHFAVEPVTNANNGVNLLAAGEPTAGTRVLDPGEALEAEFVLDVVLG